MSHDSVTEGADAAPRGWSLRPARPGDLGALTGIAIAAKAHWGYPAEWIEIWRDLLTIHPADLSRWRITVAAHGDAPLGFAAVDVRGARALLEHCWVRPDAMGRGVGRALVEDAIAAARESGASALEVEADPNAEGFYRRLGMRRIGERPADILGVRRRLPVLELPLDATLTA